MLKIQHFPTTINRISASIGLNKQLFQISGLQVLTVGAAAELWSHVREQSRRRLLLTFHFQGAVRRGNLGGHLVFPSLSGRVDAALLHPTFPRLDLRLVWFEAEFMRSCEWSELRERQSSVQIWGQLLLLTHVATLRLQHLTNNTKTHLVN